MGVRYSINFICKGYELLVLPQDPGQPLLLCHWMCQCQYMHHHPPWPLPIHDQSQVVIPWQILIVAAHGFLDNLEELLNISLYGNFLI